MESKARLERITVHNHHNVQVRSYHLSYNTDPLSRVQRIASLQECGIGGTSCLPATQFDWYQTLAHRTRSTADVALGDEPLHSPCLSTSTAMV